MKTTKVFTPSILSRFFWAVCALILLGLPTVGLAITPGKFRDPGTLREITPSGAWKNLIVVTHGWNPEGDPDVFGSSFWPDLRQNLADAVLGTDWQVILYDWSPDASTGWPGFNLAALNGDEHGGISAGIIASSCLNLRQIHFISHSAGAWVTRRSLINTVAANPFLVGQMTLLDAFVPGDLPIESPTYDNSRKLNREAMEQLRFIGLLKRLNRLDNYYVQDAGTGWLATQATFNWLPGTDLGGIRLDFDNDPYGNQPGNEHSAPILFYADSVEVGDYVQRNGLPPGSIPTGAAGTRLSSIKNSAGSLYDSRSLGWFQSFFYQRNSRPYFSTPLPAEEAKK